MYLAMIAILGAAGSWAVWKRNPLYSAGKTWRIVGAMGLGLGAFVAMDILLVNLTIHSSPWIAGGSMTALILTAVFGMFLISRAFTTTKEQPLPAGLPLLNVYRKKLYWWAKWSGITIALFALLGLALPIKYGLIGYMLAAACAFFAAFMLPIGYVTARDRDRALTGVEAQPWVHWRFSDEQWKQITQLEVVSTTAAQKFAIDWKGNWKAMLVSSVVVALFARMESGSWLEALLVFAGIVALMVVLVLLIRLNGRYMPGRKQRAMSRSAHDVFFSDGGLFWEGEFSPWISMNLYLVAASVDSGTPRMLVFDFEKVVVGQAGSSVFPVEHRVLIPDGAEAEVRSLQEKLAARCPKAVVRLC